MNNRMMEKEYEIHYYEVDYKNRAYIMSLIDYFNDVSTFQSEKLGIGIDYMIGNNLAWILYKWDIDVKEYPKYGDTVIVTTEPCAFKKFYGYRKFQILDRNRRVIATASSAWLLISISERKPIRVPDHLIKTYGLSSDDNKILNIENISDLEKVDNAVEFKVRYSDIDTNGHVNNAKYAAWLIESIPLDIVKDHTLTNIKLTYKKECRYGEAVKIVCDIKSINNKIVAVHRVIREDEEITLGETTWEVDKK